MSREYPDGLHGNGLPVTRHYCPPCDHEWWCDGGSVWPEARRGDEIDTDGYLADLVKREEDLQQDKADANGPSSGEEGGR